MTHLQTTAASLYQTLLLSLTFLLVNCGMAIVSQAQDDDVVRTNVSLVQLNVGVVDAQGRPITSLSQNDFSVYED